MGCMAVLMTKWDANNKHGVHFGSAVMSFGLSLELISQKLIKPKTENTSYER